MVLVVSVAVLSIGPGVAMAGTAASITGTEARPLMNVVVDSLSACNPSSLQRITIDWGDGSTSVGSAFEVGANGCDISGSHTYAEEGSYVTEVSYVFATGGMGEDAGSATVADAPVGASAVNDFVVSAGSAISGVVGHWSDSAPDEALSSYSATINWGDGHSSAGTIVIDGDIDASHTYVNGGRFTITIAFHDEGGASVVAHEYAVVSGCPAFAPSAPSAPFTPSATGLDRRYVQALYHDILGRAPGPSELNAWVNALSKGVTRSQLVLSILDSSEYRANLIASDYQRYLRRNPTPSETSAWLPLLGSGASDESFAANILGSGEYFANRGDDSNDGFLSALYCDAVFRSIDQFTQNNDDSALGSGTSRTTLASGVVGSIEYLSQLVNGFYLHYLRRSGTPGELAVFANVIHSGASDEQVIASILASDEYFDIFDPRTAFASTAIVHGNTITITLSRSARLAMTVLRFVPSGHTAAVKVPRSDTKLIGIVNFGRHHKGRIKLHWTRTVQGKRLERGRYLLILNGYHRHKLIGVTNAVPLTVR